MKKRDIAINGLLAFIVLLMLYWKYDVSIHRYFDIDEFAHMHWGFNFYSGMKPYSQYLYFFPPLFLFVTYPIFALVPHTFQLFSAMRVMAFLIYMLLLCGLFLLSNVLGILRETNRSRRITEGLLTLIVLIFLPLPYDKFIEVRPDTLATSFVLFGIVFQLSAFLYQKKRTLLVFLSGLLYGLALATVPKVIFFIPGAGIAVLGLVKKEKSWSHLIPFVVGIAIPAFISLTVIIRSGDIAKAIYLMTSFASHSTQVLGWKFPIEPNLFFYPNDVFYGIWGYSTPLVLNLVIFLVAGLWGSIRLMTAGAYEKKERCIAEVLISMTFILNFIAYIKLFPLKHTQYFISFAPFIALYGTDFFFSLVRSIESSKLLRHVSVLGIVVLACTLGYQSYVMHGIKIQWKDWATQKDVTQVMKVLPEDAWVLDLTGESVFYKDPYYVCCLPYGQYIEAFSFDLPSLPEALKTTQTRYVYTTTKDRVGILPPQDQVFIQTHYVPLLTDPYLLIAGADVILPEATEKKFDIIIPGEYELLQQQLSKIEIDGVPLTQTKMNFTAGKHTVKSSDKDELIIRLVQTTS